MPIFFSTRTHTATKMATAIGTKMIAFSVMQFHMTMAVCVS